jgi:hypothetical protein
VLTWISVTAGRRTAESVTITADRDHQGAYVLIITFPSYDAAMENSRLPDTEQFARRLTELCTAPLVFQNLEVRRVEDLAE